MTVIGELSQRMVLMFAAWSCAAFLMGRTLERPDFLTSSRRAIVATAVFIVLATMAPWGHWEYTITIRPGTPVMLRDAVGSPWQFTSDGVSEFEVGDSQVVAVSLEPVHHGASMPLVVSVLDRDPSMFNTWAQQVRVALLAVGQDESAQVHIVFIEATMISFLTGTIIVVVLLACTLWPLVFSHRSSNDQAFPRP